MSPGKFPDVQWEDDDKDFGVTKDREDDAGGEFVDMLAQDEQKNQGRDTRFLVGEKVKGVVAKVPQGGGTDILIDLGASKASAIVEKVDFQDENGQLKVKVGDPVELFVISKKGGEILLSTKMSQALKSAGDLENAFARKTPIRGKVAKVVKGGFEITVLGKAAFCPVSQLDIRFVEDPNVHVGQEYEFVIEKFEEGGRNVVLNRATLLRAQAEERLKQLMTTLKPDTVLDGVVSEVRDFGAFVDIGGVEGLVHVSQLGHARVVKASDVVHKGDKVRVKVLKIETEGGKPKISLSMKATAKDPWDEIHSHVEGGKTYTGKVTNLMPFGAFIEIAPGVEGLLHVSEMSWMKRIHHPSELVKLGDRVTVTVKDIDTHNRRISLSMKNVEDDPWFDADKKYPAGRSLKAPVEKLKPFGALVELAPGLSGLLPMAVIKRKFGEAYRQPCTPGKELEVRIVQLDKAQKRVLLTLEGVEEENADQKDYLEYVAAEKEAAKVHEAKTQDAPRAGSFGALLSAKLGQKNQPS